MDHWICLLGFLRVALCLPSLPYTLHQEKVSFDDALNTCRQEGFLTDMAAKEEMDKIISVTSEIMHSAGTFEFWVGLRKSQSDCVFEDPPLMGFKWTANNSSHSEVNKWLEKPAKTCTSVLCGLLIVEYSGERITNWGWKGTTCKTEHPFICRRIKNETSQCPNPQLFQVREFIPVVDNPYLLEVHCLSSKTFILTCSPTNKEWMLGNRSADLTGLCLTCQAGYTRDEGGNCVDFDECTDKQLCTFGCRNTEGSYICICDTASGYVQDENATSCKKLLASTNTPPSSTHFLPPINSSPQATNGKELPPTPTLGSPTTTIITTTAHVNLEISRGQSSIFIPVLVAVVSLVALGVTVLLFVKCCLGRRSKKISRKERGKSKETVILKDAADCENQKDSV
ncbi:C-type lectin domain family 14 member A [Megalops cyprinoides]|uniref:C-type lectin domain family 14 member A n=1 Tax=Megalops cyprinoides TaxID=118141 RepID=UPI001864367D|nr:C-type lectin domain family 14 member A [Megalops cyprinoides]